MSAKPRTIKFTDADWQALKALAASEDITLGKLINRAVGDYAANRGIALDGTGSHGDPRRFRQYEQCTNCDGWNVGAFDGQLICADCGHIQDNG